MLSLWRAVLVFTFTRSWYGCIGDSGTATFYNHYVLMIALAASACFGNDTSKFLPGNMIAAASDPLWKNGTVCGKKYRVSCSGPANGVPMPCKSGSDVVIIVDHCPNCGGTIDLSQEAFTAIANPVAGIIKIDYQQA